jgi:hypothetical protein
LGAGLPIKFIVNDTAKGTKLAEYASFERPCTFCSRDLIWARSRETRKVNNYFEEKKAHIYSIFRAYVRGRLTANFWRARTFLHRLGEFFLILCRSSQRVFEFSRTKV